MKQAELYGGPRDGEELEADGFCHPVIIMPEGFYVCGCSTLDRHVYYWRGIEVPEGNFRVLFGAPRTANPEGS